MTIQGRRAWHRRAALGLVAAASAVAVALALPGGARANHLDLSVSVGKSAKLVAGVYLAVPVNITCPSDLSNGSFTILSDETVEVGVTQKTSGRAFAQGSGGFGYSDNTVFGGGIYGTPLTCDGAAHTYVTNVYPNIEDGSAPFHGGQAVVNVSMWIYLRDSTCLWCSADVSYQTTGPRTISVRG